MKDAIGRPIKIGSILRHRIDRTQGVVVEIGMVGRLARHVQAVGMIAIQTSYGSYRCTNHYDEWIHVEREWTTAVERYRSFLVTPWEHDDSIAADPMEALAMEFVAALLPKDPWEDEDTFPSDLETVLLALAETMDAKLHQKLPS